MGASVLYSQNYWEFINPTPTGNTLHSVCFANAQTGIAVGNLGTIIKTTNAGQNWIVDNSFKGEGFFEYQNFWDVAFVNENDGYISGYKLLKTNNRGNTWEVIPTGNLVLAENYRSNYFGFFYNNLDTGFVTGINPNTGNYELRKTYNAGAAWTTKLILDTDPWVHQIFFTDATHGWLVCAEKIYKTTDAGENWIEVLPNMWFTYYYNIYFTDNNTGFLRGYEESGGMAKTTDGGLTWFTLSPVGEPGQFYFKNDTTAYMTCYDGTGSVIEKTTNAGQNWTIVLSGYGFSSIDFIDQNTAIAVGGGIIKFDDTNNNYSCERLDKTENLFAMGKFFNNKIYSCGPGAYKCSDDHGVSWATKVIDNSPQFDIRSMFFVNESTGFAVSYDGGFSTTSKVYKTTNGGNTWNVKYITNSLDFFSDIYFVNDAVGYAVGGRTKINPYPEPNEYNGIVFKTTDGGETWTVANNSVGRCLYSLYFTNADTGYVCGMSGNTHAFIGKTTDGGVTWSLTNTTALLAFYRILFTSNNTGYTSGYRGVIFKTTNSGLTWTQQSTGETNTMGNICALNSDTVYVSANTAYLRTTNGGTTWTKERFKQEIYGTPSIHFYNDTTGIAISQSGSNIAGIAFLRLGHFLPTSKLAVYGTGTYCFGSTGLPVYMPKTEYNVNYTLYKNGVSQTTLLANTDSLSFGNQLAGTYTVHATNQYGTTVMQDTVIIIEIQPPSQPSTITGTTTPLQSSSQIYSVTNVAGTTYNWTFPSDWAQTAGGTTNSVTLTIGLIAGDVVCTPSNACGAGTSQTLFVTPQPDAISVYANNNNISIFPNPTDGKVTITFKGLNNNITLKLLNIQGSLVYTTSFDAVSDNFAKTLDLSKYSNGMYYIQVICDGKTFIQKLVKQ